jgi:mRNA interferase MazF
MAISSAPEEEPRPGRGDVVILPHGTGDAQAEKRRPALIVSGPSLDEPYDLVWVMMITSADNPSLPTDLPIRDLDRAGLPAPSVIRPAKIACIERSRIVRRAGKVSDSDMRSVGRALKAFLDLA